MTLIRILLAAAALGFLAMIVNAGLQADIFESFAAVAADPWGAVSLVDLYIGFFAFAVVIWVFEPDTRIKIAAIVLMPFLGNLIALPWLAWRLPRMVRAAALK